MSSEHMTFIQRSINIDATYMNAIARWMYLRRRMRETFPNFLQRKTTSANMRVHPYNLILKSKQWFPIPIKITSLSILASPSPLFPPHTDKKGGKYFHSHRSFSLSIPLTYMLTLFIQFDLWNIQFQTSACPDTCCTALHMLRISLSFLIFYNGLYFTCWICQLLLHKKKCRTLLTAVH